MSPSKPNSRSRARIGYAYACALAQLAACGSDGAAPATEGRGEPVQSTDAGADGSANTCGFPPCGGDITGVWTTESSCLTSTSFPDCDEGKIDVSNAVMRGTMEFRADGTYVTTVGAVGTMGMNMPASCLMGADCDGFEASLAAQTGDDFSSIACEGTETCKCIMHGQPQIKTGTYTLYGDVVVASAPDSKGNVHTDTFDFCVSEGKLKLGTAAGSPSPVTMSLVMTK